MRALTTLAVAMVLSPAGAATNDPPAIVALVIDTSGSLSRTDLERTKKLAVGLLENLPARSEVAVFSFDDQSRLVQPRTSSADELRSAVGKLGIAGRYTALHDALFDASRYLKDAPAPRRAIVLVTDGKDENSALQLEDALKVAEETPIPVFTVGVGRVEERILRRIAKLTSGEYLNGRDASGAVVASKLLATPVSLPFPPTSGAPSAAPAAPAAAAPPRSLAAPARRWPWLLLGLAALGAIALIAASLRRRPARSCPSCGRDLPGAASECSLCAADASAGTLIAPRIGTLDEHASPTVLARMDLTEEYLEKTVTLREMPVLTITSGAGSGMIFSLNRQSVTSLGRAKANDIVLEDVSVSSQHARIRPEGGKFVLHDLKSTNGTFANERRVTHHVLAEGDTIKIGETYLQFRTNQKKA